MKYVYLLQEMTFNPSKDVYEYSDLIQPFSSNKKMIRSLISSIECNKGFNINRTSQLVSFHTDRVVKETWVEYECKSVCGKPMKLRCILYQMRVN